ncbi:DUF192 domain-containing protein [Natrarchaeobaculum aegyptiacum]|uniref:DUF192 domain-containing protein n=1 Tax=Natrarchaeobaculum aegyptiacum TaxID=745377 RepID=A0A2Z2HPD9_9EURY|nr:DUF192 domain-containing protein [Natrarchaeobaculum aegyptiacum]ARS88880.1 hypothetical protein B1756_03330 [Natrarchaeobaculum aegyptiacum]
MRVVHHPAAGSSDGSVLASEVEVADTLVSQTRGLMFRRSLPDDYALAFPFDSASTRDVHMLFVFVPLDVIWVTDGVVERVERLRPWLGLARAKADLILELPAGRASAVEPGDRVVLEERP